MANMATYHFIRNNEFDDTLAIATVLLEDRQDLIPKAVRWMLREVGNRDRLVEKRFLKTNYRKMPRTMLRYAIERFPETTRQTYLKGRI
jgi:3-methyladenine DNA glycosylase AlkD